MIRKIITTATALLFVTAAAVHAGGEDGANGNAGPGTGAYGTNILRVAPLTAMDVGVGFGVSYEKIFGEAQMIGVVIPVTMLLENKNANEVGTLNENRFNTYVYFTPGLKIYPFGQRKVTYAIGPNLMLGYGGGNEYQYRNDIYGGAYLEDVKTTRLRLGVLINNYVNFQISRSFNLGLEGGLGMRYLDRVSYSGSTYYAGNGDFNNGFDITGQFSLTLGFRF